jgi:plasmid stabilization system protein ParE
VDDRVADPRHLLVYRVAPDGIVEILSIVHDRMQLQNAARRARRAATHEKPLR